MTLILSHSRRGKTVDILKRPVVAKGWMAGRGKGGEGKKKKNRWNIRGF